MPDDIHIDPEDLLNAGNDGAADEEAAGYHANGHGPDIEVEDEITDYSSMTFEELRAAAAQLQAFDGTAAEEILRAALGNGVVGIQIEELIGIIAKATKLGLRPFRARLGELRIEQQRAKAPTEEELQERARQAEEAAAAALAAYIAELEEKVRPLASDPDLMKRQIQFAHDLGLIGEDAAAAAIFLTLVSRVLRDKALCIARTGAPASGKNVIVEIIIKQLPKPATGPNAAAFRPRDKKLIRLSGGSEKVIYYLGDDEDYLIGKVIYIPEATALLDVRGAEKEMAGALRTLISEGYFEYHVVQMLDDGSGNKVPTAVVIVRNGPVPVIITTARNNIEPELLTRLVILPSNESVTQSGRVATSILRASGGHKREQLSGTTTEEWQAYHEWLDLTGPHEAIIPFENALAVAFYRLGNKKLRIRRDVSAIVTAIVASAVAHKMQRQTDERGRIVAELDDYRWAHFALADGLKTLYAPQMSEKVIAVVRFMEEKRDEQKAVAAEAAAAKAASGTSAGADFYGQDMQSLEIVTVTHSQIMSGLGLGSKDTVFERVQDAITAGLIEVTNAHMPRSQPRSYRVLVGSAAAANTGALAVGMPDPDEVERLFLDQDALFDATMEMMSEFDAQDADAKKHAEADAVETEDEAGT